MSSAIAAFCLLLGGAGADSVEAVDKELAELAATGKITDRKNYDPLAEKFARRFAALNELKIDEAFADDKSKIEEWFAAHPAVRVKLHAAFSEKDDVVAGLKLFRAIWKKHADKLEKYDDLAVATVVVWDQPRNVHDFNHHARRTKSEVPGGQVGGIENFEYALANDAALGGKAQFLPWEFLVFVIDHTTPLEERKWAQRYVAASRGKKSWHQDVPYDYDMLNGERGQSTRPHLEGKPYTLPNIREFGGVCAMQADFAARVGKSALTPACYCSGASAHRGGHAWWMFVRIDAATEKGAIKCSLVSDGRFDGKDQFHTGGLRDPQTGEDMLDRDMERRLAVTGRDVVAKRHADLCMRAYSIVAESEKYDFKKRLAFLDKVLKLAPYEEAAWSELANQARFGEIDAKARAAMLTRLSGMSKLFAAYPDFLWKHFGNMMRAVEKPKERSKLWGQVVAAFIAAGRPDLTCAAAAELADELAERKSFAEAGRTLQDAVRKFPYEGRYVPKLLGQFEKLGGEYKGGQVEVARLYVELLPAMFDYYKSADDDYCKKMIEQATKYLDANGLADYSQKIRALAANADRKKK